MNRIRIRAFLSTFITACMICAHCRCCPSTTLYCYTILYTRTLTVTLNHVECCIAVSIAHIAMIPCQELSINILELSLYQSMTDTWRSIQSTKVRQNYSKLLSNTFKDTNKLWAKDSPSLKFVRMSLTIFQPDLN